MMTQEKETHPGQVIWQQIPVMTKMACGARKAVLTETGVRFQVGGKPMRYIEVTLDAANDTYNVRHFRVKRNDYSQIDLETLTGVYADMLGEVCYRAVNK